MVKQQCRRRQRRVGGGARQLPGETSGAPPLHLFPHLQRHHALAVGPAQRSEVSGHARPAIDPKTERREHALSLVAVIGGPDEPDAPCSPSSSATRRPSGLPEAAIASADFFRPGGVNVSRARRVFAESVGGRATHDRLRAEKIDSPECLPVPRGHPRGRPPVRVASHRLESPWAAATLPNQAISDSHSQREVPRKKAIVGALLMVSDVTAHDDG